LGISPAAGYISDWRNVFRHSVTLFEEMDILKSALEAAVRRFPSIAAREIMKQMLFLTAIGGY